MPSSDAIIIGGGVNGLACAARLAAKGRKVVLLEAGSAAGGGAGLVEFTPGYHAPALAHTTQGLDPRVIKGMKLERHGLAFHAPLSTTALGTDGNHLAVLGGKTSGPDAAAYAALHRKLSDFARVLAPFRLQGALRLPDARATSFSV